MISIILSIIIVGVLLWLVNAVIPMEPRVKQILNAVVIVCLVLWLLQAFGIFNSGVDFNGCNARNVPGDGR